MALPVTIPNEFANATASIPLSQLDTNFNTLANAVNGISDGSETLANVTATVANITTANVGALNTSGPVVFNDAGADVDFRVEGDTEANLLFVDAGNDRVAIGTGSPAARLTSVGTPTVNAFSASIPNDPNSSPVAVITAGANTNGGIFGGGGTGLRIIDKTSNSGSGQIGTGLYVAAPFDGTNASGGTYALTKYGIYVDDIYNFYGINSPTGNTNWGIYVKGGANNYIAGNLGIGTTSPISTNNNRLSVEAGNTEAIVTKSSGGATYTPVFIWNTATSGDNYFLYFATEGGPYGGTNRGSVDFNRGAGLTRYNTTSDATLKNIIGDSNGAKSVEILNSTRIREFAWKDDETQKPQIGVIAQELYETYKGAVSVGGDVEKERDVTEEVEEEYTDENGETQTRTVTKVVGKETYTEYRLWGVDKTAFTFHLVAGWQAHEKALQEAMERIETLEAKVTALENA